MKPDSTPKTESVCKHCRRPKCEHDGIALFCRTKSVYQFEPVAEPASTGERKKRMMQKPYGGEIHEECPDCRGVCSEYVAAARPSEPSAFEGIPKGITNTLPGPEPSAPQPSTPAEWRRQESCSECDGDGCANCAPQTSAEPHAAEPYIPIDSRATPREFYDIVRELAAALQPVSGMYVSETKPHKVDDAIVAEIFNREPVSGDAPERPYENLCEALSDKSWLTVPEPTPSVSTTPDKVGPIIAEMHQRAKDIEIAFGAAPSVAGTQPTPECPVCGSSNGRTLTVIRCDNCGTDQSCGCPEDTCEVPGNCPNLPRKSSGAAQGTPQVEEMKRTLELMRSLYSTVEEDLQSGRCSETWPEIWQGAPAQPGPGCQECGLTLEEHDDPKQFIPFPAPAQGTPEPPKVEEILITDARLEQIKQIRAYGLQAEPTALLLAIDDLLHALRPYFPPASQTPNEVVGIEYYRSRLAFLRNQIGFIERNFPELATPASTARTDGWVSVEDGLPKATGVYGIYPPEQIDKDQGLNFSPRYFCANEDRNTYVGNKLAYGWVKDKNHKVTHWRELPAAPGSVPQAPKRPTIVVLCGSTRFYSYFQEANYRETMAGKIVLSIGFYPRDGKHNESVGCTPEQKIALDELYFRKIELADEVLVLNVGGYMGESTTREVAYAAKLGKKINYLEAGVPQAEPPKEEK